MAQAVTVEQAACNALQRWLQAGLAGVTVWARWPDPDSPLAAGVVSIIRAGAAKEITIEPVVDSFSVIHADVSPRPATTAAAVVDLPTSVAALNVMGASYETHRMNSGAHVRADTANAVTAPAASDQPTAEALANNLLAVLVPHLTAAAHATPDGQVTLATAVPVPSGNLPALVALVRLLVTALSTHYPARVYTWRLADVEQHLQLDVWAQYEPTRDDLVARLVPLLHADPSASAGFTASARPDPVREGTLVQLADGWTGYADFLFDEPSLTMTETSEKKREFRATYRGIATLWRLMKAQSPRMSRAQLLGTVTAGQPFGALLADAAGGAVTTTITT